MGLDPDRLRSDLPDVRFLRARSSVFLCYIALITDASALRSRWHDGIRCHESPRSWCGPGRGPRSIADALLDGYPMFDGRAEQARSACFLHAHRFESCSSDTWECLVNPSDESHKAANVIKGAGRHG